MNYIDLHIHTQKLKSGDGNGRVISSTDLVNKLQSNQVKVASITNHNKFDLEEFTDIVKQEPEFTIFPGIELDVDFDNENIKHIVLISDPNIVRDFHHEFSNDKNRNYDNFKLDYSLFIEKVRKFNKKEIIIIPHFLDKDKKRALSIVEKEKLLKDLSEYVVILETGKFKSMGIINAHNEISIFGSDIKQWSNYDQEVKKLPQLKFEIDSFGKFYSLASNPNLFIKTALNGMDKLDVPIESTKIEIFNDINVVFGEKGSGKTIILKNYMIPFLKECGYSLVFHEGKDYQQSYDEIILKISEQLQIDQELKRISTSRLTEILSYNEKMSADFINSYIFFYREEKISKNAKLIKLTETNYSQVPTGSFEEFFEELESRLKKIKATDKINKEVRNQNDENIETLSIELNKLKKDVILIALEGMKKIFSISQTDKLITSVKSILDKKTGKKSKPNNIGFQKLIADRYKFSKACSDLIDSLENQRKTKRISLGDLPNKGEVLVNTSVVVLNKEEKFYGGSPFDRNRISNNRELIKKISEFKYGDFARINSLFSPAEQNRPVEEYIDDWVKKVTKIIRKDGSSYEPSEGEKSILSISGILENTSYDCYIFDEIERSLGHKYISDYLIQKLMYLRDIGKLVIISTHNANIAISTLPSQSIFCNYRDDDTRNIYYSGNMYSDDLISVDDDTDLISWEKEALKHLEGSSEMFGIRRNIWKLTE